MAQKSSTSETNRSGSRCASCQPQRKHLAQLRRAGTRLRRVRSPPPRLTWPAPRDSKGRVAALHVSLADNQAIDDPRGIASCLAALSGLAITPASRIGARGWNGSSVWRCFCRLTQTSALWRLIRLVAAIVSSRYSRSRGCLRTIGCDNGSAARERKAFVGIYDTLTAAKAKLARDQLDAVFADAASRPASSCANGTAVPLRDSEPITERFRIARALTAVGGVAMRCVDPRLILTRGFKTNASRHPMLNTVATSR